MVAEIFFNLIATLIGLLIGLAYSYYKEKFSQRAMKWFWYPTPAKKIYLVYGSLSNPNESERENVINEQDAFTLGELRVFLEQYYSEVIITSNESEIDWKFPVVSLGGPVPNQLTKRIGKSGILPFWFEDAQSSEETQRVITTRQQEETFSSSFENGKIKSDVGFIAKIPSPDNAFQYCIVIAANYGIGTLGIVRYLTETDKVRKLRKLNKGNFFQSVIRSHVLNKSIMHTELVQNRLIRIAGDESSSENSPGT